MPPARLAPSLRQSLPLHGGPSFGANPSVEFVLKHVERHILIVQVTRWTVRAPLLVRWRGIRVYLTRFREQLAKIFADPVPKTKGKTGLASPEKGPVFTQDRTIYAGHFTHGNGGARGTSLAWNIRRACCYLTGQELPLPFKRREEFSPGSGGGKCADQTRLESGN